MSSSAAATDGPLYSILRIKRKRTASSAPLDALVIDTSEPSNKRRRNETQAGDVTKNRGIFRFAETVPLDSFDTDSKTRQLKDRITAFLSHPPPALSRVSSSTSLNASTPGTPTTRKPTSASTSSLRRVAVDSGSASPQSGSPSQQQQKRDQRVRGFHEQSKRARYRIIEKQRDEADQLWQSERASVASRLRDGPRPPEVLVAAELNRVAPAIADQTRIYEAIAEDDLVARDPRILSSATDDADMMSNFVPMLQDFLTLQDSKQPKPAPHGDVAPAPTLPLLPAEILQDEDGDADFVYDVYYRDLRDPVAGNLTAATGDVDVGGLAGLKRIGELAGLEDDEILTEELSSEEEDDADQDSNEENDYRNDYPDEESDNSDDDGYDDDERWE